MDDLLQQQLALQNESKELLGKLELLSTLQDVGETSLVGSLELGLMTWRDIDVEVIVSSLDKDYLSQVMSAVTKHTKRRIDFSFIDTTFTPKAGMPDGHYLGIKYEVDHDKDITWKIDIWFVVGEHTDGFIKTQELREQLKEEHLLPILTIKNEVCTLPTYRKVVQSIDIYDAVLNHGVKDLEGFKNYLQTKGKSLE